MAHCTLTALLHSALILKLYRYLLLSVQIVFLCELYAALCEIKLLVGIVDLHYKPMKHPLWLSDMSCLLPH